MIVAVVFAAFFALVAMYAVVFNILEERKHQRHINSMQFHLDQSKAETASLVYRVTSDTQYIAALKAVIRDFDPDFTHPPGWFSTGDYDLRVSTWQETI